jgi:holo-ACP synthase
VVRGAPCAGNQGALRGAGAEHPLGRLWDLDVICPQDGHVGRLSLGLHMRRCLVCDEPAHVCSRSRKHPVEQVVAGVEKMIDDWFARD